jgi:DNA-binding MarR family transcriptional regulator
LVLDEQVGFLLRVALTKTGRAVAAQATRVARRITHATLVPLTAAEQNSVLRLLKKLIRGGVRMNAPASPSHCAVPPLTG